MRLKINIMLQVLVPVLFSIGCSDTFVPGAGGPDSPGDSSSAAGSGVAEGTAYCGAGQVCDLGCAEGDCYHECEGNDSLCTATCGGGACDFTCEEGASCAMDCAGGGCTLDCDSDAIECDFSCEGSPCIIEECGANCSCSGSGCP